MKEPILFRTLRSLTVMVIVALGLCGCEAQSKGFALPPGDVDRGLVAFTELQCNHCHRIKDIVVRAEDSPYPGIDVRLGGPVSRIKTYGELVTSIIHPNAGLSRGETPATLDAQGNSKMRNYNDRMTVTQLVDLATFLQQTYEIWIPEYRPYMGP